MDSVWTESTSVDVFVMLSSDACCEFERWSRVKGQTRVIRSSRCSHRPLWFDGNTVDLGTLSRDLANTVAAVPCDTMAEPLPAISNSDDALAVTVPGNVVDPSGDDLVLAFCGTFPYTIPDLDVARSISACNVEARRTEPGNGGVCGMIDILS